MKEPFRDQTEEAKAAHRVAKEASDEAWLYYGSCHRAMAQGDCVLDDIEGPLRCAHASSRWSGALLQVVWRTACVTGLPSETI